MPDFARSSDPAVQHQLDRLAALSPGGDVLGLDRITRLLAALGDPHRALPPVFHVAGTNGKGSTCAFLRSMLEAAGHRVHVYTSPHLVRFNERIRLAGTLIDDAALAGFLAEVFDACRRAFADQEPGPSFFEVTTAAAFLAFSREPAEALVLEVGLGGRLDATNVVDAPVVAGIAGLGLDHQFFLGETLPGIAGEKAGIAKRGVPLVTQRYASEAATAVEAAARTAGGRWLPCGGEWNAEIEPDALRYVDRHGALDLPLPRLPGAHQAMNAALAAAMIRHQDAVVVPVAALRDGIERAEWPARLQRLGSGPLVDSLPAGAEVWLDGAHNPTAAAAVAAFLRDAVPSGRALRIVCGLLANKDAAGVIGALADSGAVFWMVPVPGHASHAPAELVLIARAAGLQAIAAADVGSALDAVSIHGGALLTVLIMGSLYLAGEVLRDNGQAPD